MTIPLVLAFLFFSGSILGWILELFYRKFFSRNNPERRWINPGFLIGPYLPLYGFSLCILCLLSFIDVPFVQNEIYRQLILFVLMAVCITLIEFIAGLIFIHGMKVRLWDYSKCFGNIMGIVCPQYSLYWIILSALYYFLIHPKVLHSLYWLSEHLTFSFVIGFFYGIFIIDLCYSLNVLTKIREFAKENEIIIKIESLKSQIRKINDEFEASHPFIFALKAENKNLKDHLKLYFENHSKKTK